MILHDVETWEIALLWLLLLMWLLLLWMLFLRTNRNLANEWQTLIFFPINLWGSNASTRWVEDLTGTSDKGPDAVFNNFCHVFNNEKFYTIGIKSSTPSSIRPCCHLWTIPNCKFPKIDKCLKVSFGVLGRRNKHLDVPI